MRETCGEDSPHLKRDGTRVARSVGVFGLNKTKRVAWHKHLVKGRKYAEQRRVKVAAAATSAPAAKR